MKCSKSRRPDPAGELTTLPQTPSRQGLLAFCNRSFAPSALALSPIFSISVPKLYTDLRLWSIQPVRSTRLFTTPPFRHLFPKIRKSLEIYYNSHRCCASAITASNSLSILRTKASAFAFSPLVNNTNSFINPSLSPPAWPIHSFIHTEHLYSASSRKLLRDPTDSSTAKKSCLKLRKKRRWQGSRENPKLRRESIPDRGTHHGKSTALLSGGTSKRDQEKTLLRW